MAEAREGLPDLASCRSSFRETGTASGLLTESFVIAGLSSEAVILSQLRMKFASYTGNRHLFATLAAEGLES